METPEIYTYTGNEIYTVKLDDLMIKGTVTPNHTFTFNNTNGAVGHLNFNGDTMVFTGDADESAKVFLTLVDFYFQQRLKGEYKRGLTRAVDITIASMFPHANLIANQIRMEMLDA